MFAKKLLKSAPAKLAVVSVASLALTSCVSRAEVEEIKANQEKILAKLEKMPTGGGAQARAPQRPRGPDASTTYAVPVGQAATKGPKDAWVTIVEISDFQCPYCKRVGPTLDALQKKYGDDLRIAFRHNALPFHKQAKPAARAAECAGEQGKFWEMHDKMFENQRALEDANLEQYAGAIGLNAGSWKSCFTSGKFDAKIDGDQREAQKFGARGTPAFFVNGRFLSGAQPQASFEALIDQELKKAKDSGISKGDYYAKAILGKGKKSM